MKWKICQMLTKKLIPRIIRKPIYRMTWKSGYDFRLVPFLLFLLLFLILTDLFQVLDVLLFGKDFLEA